jgi:MinD-like ATPase involved in chromosome partitioning or flagellar assembly
MHLLLVGNDRRLERYKTHYAFQVLATFPDPETATPYVMADVQPPDAILVDIGNVYAAGVENKLIEMLDAARKWNVRTAVVLGEQHAHIELRHAGVQQFTVGGEEQAAEYLGLSMRSGVMGIAVMVSNAKGGVGKSSVVANAALALAQRHDQRVAAVDGDFFDGNLASMLGVPNPPTTILDLARQHNVRRALPDYLITMQGVDVLPAPTTGGFERIDIGRRQALGILEGLREMYDFVILDIPPDVRYSTPFAGALWNQGGERVMDWLSLVVVQPQPLERDGAERILRLMSRLGVRDRAFGVLVHTRPVKARRRRLAEALGVDIVADIPYDEAIAGATSADQMTYVFNGDRLRGGAKAYAGLSDWLIEYRRVLRRG